MNELRVVAALGALAFLAWPQVSTALKRLKMPSFSSEPSAPSYRQAIESLALVRYRLRTTDCLQDAQKAAIDSLTLALVSGSDK